MSKVGLLDVLRERSTQQQIQPIISRIVICGKKIDKSKSKEDIETYFRKKKDFDRDRQVAEMDEHPMDERARYAPATGILLIMPDSIVYILEASARAIFDMLRALQREPTVMSNIKVLLYMDDIIPAFPLWTAQAIPSVTSADIALGTNEKMIHAAVQHMLNLRAAVREADFLRAANPRDLPSNEMFLNFCASTDCCSIEEFLALYASPIDIQLESERVWPTPQPLHVA